MCSLGYGLFGIVTVWAVGTIDCMSEPIDTTNDAIASAATSPRMASVDGRSAESRSVDDLLKIAAYQAAQTAATNSKPGFGLRFQKIRPPGAG